MSHRYSPDNVARRRAMNAPLHSGWRMDRRDETAWAISCELLIE
jgi:hypothetical protein